MRKTGGRGYEGRRSENRAVNKVAKRVEGNMLKIGFAGNNVKECGTMNSLRSWLISKLLMGTSTVAMPKPTSSHSGNKAGCAA
ncbi:hypothetical protein VNO80_26599 [Phaseolus coccineus]|uniref:Uncharacterized protein n=1 Tax=Phaseolus coccineus TaxID=3886 RepID=A0AAN9QKM7_PHACN